MQPEQPDRSKFPNDFIWGVSTSAPQTEGGANDGSRGASIWDDFQPRGLLTRKKIVPGDTCDFQHHYRQDIDIIHQLGIRNFRLSIAWPRILPDGKGKVNQAGIDFYRRVFDYCLSKGITPWVTLYHWDLPLALEKEGGWTNRDIVHWFCDYVRVCIDSFKDQVRHWMVMNEPLVFTGAGYFIGVHAPGRRGMNHFLPALHHALLAQGKGSRLIRSLQPEAMIGSTFSCSQLTPYNDTDNDKAAVQRMDALLNRLMIEPALGMGYPIAELPVLKRLENSMQPGDEKDLIADFDFVGVQNYTREVVSASRWVPYLGAKLVPAKKRAVLYTEMGWEIHPSSMYEMIKQFSSYPQIKKLFVTENGASFRDQLVNDQVDDQNRRDYFKGYISQMQKAVHDGFPVKGYFVWSLTDNFEWAEAYKQRFGLVYIDFSTQERTIKESGYWYKDFLQR